MPVNIVEDIKSVTELKTQTREVLEQVHRTRRPVVITVNGKPDVVIVDAVQYEHQQQTLNLAALLAQGEADIREGHIRPAEDFIRELSMPTRYRVEITASAERDVLAILDCIAADKPTAAVKWVAAIRRQTRSLQRFPFRGTVIPEAPQVGVDYRQLIFGEYRTIYRIEAERVFVVRVIHGAQLLKTASLTF